MEDNEINVEENEIEIEEVPEEKPIITKIIDVDDLTDSFDKDEVENNLKYSILSYIGPLFIVPIVNRKYKNSKYLLFHVNQGFNLFALEIFIFIVLGLLNSIFVRVVTYAPVWLGIINFLFYSVVVVLMLLGIVNAINGKSKKLPIIGKYKFIK